MYNTSIIRNSGTFGSLNIGSGDVWLENTVISQNKVGGGIYASSWAGKVSLAITNCRLEYNNGCGIIGYGSTNTNMIINVSSCYINNNVATSNSGGGTRDFCHGGCDP